MLAKVLIFILQILWETWKVLIQCYLHIAFIFFPELPVRFPVRISGEMT